MQLGFSRIPLPGEEDLKFNQGDDWLDVLFFYDDRQLITIGGSPTGGTFRLNFRGYWTAAIAFDAAAATVQTKLEALPTIRVGKVAVTGSAGGPYTVSFSDVADDETVPLIVGDGALLTPSGSVEVDSKPVDLTGFTARMMIREHLNDVDPVATLTDGNGKLVIDALAGSIAFNVPASETAAYTWLSGVYDLELVSADLTVQKVLRGKIEIVPEVTR